MCEEPKIEIVEPIIEQPIDETSIKAVVNQPFTVEELTILLQTYIKTLIDTGRPITFEMMINVLMNAYIGLLFQFVKRGNVIATLREHCEKIVEQIVATKQHIDPEEYKPTEAKPSIILPTD